MRGSTTPVVAILSLLLGLGAGYVLFGVGTPGTTDASDGLQIDDAPSDTTGRAADEPRLEAAQDTRVATPLRAALLSVPTPVREEGEGVISGRVTDDAGVPVSGVRIGLEASDAPKAWIQPDPDEDPDVLLVRQMQRMIENHRWGSAYRQTTRSDADGHYRFEGVTKRKHRVQATRKAYQIYPRNHAHWQGVHPGATVDFRATAMAQLRVELTGSARPETLQVELRQGSGTRSGLQWSAAKPVLDCQPGTWDVHVRGGDQDELRAGPFPVELIAGDEPHLLQVELEARPVLRLHLRYTQDEVYPLYVYSMPKPSSGMPTAAALLASGEGGMMRRMGHQQLSPTTEESLQILNDLKSGTYVIGLANKYRGPILHMEEVALQGGVQDHTIQVPPLDADAYVVVGVYGPDGKVVPGAQFSTGFRSGGGSSSGGSTTAMRRDGRYLVMHHQRAETGAKDATWWVDVTVPNLGTKRVEYTSTTTRELRVEFGSPADLRVEVSGVAGTPYEGRVSLALQPGDASRNRGRSQSAKADAEGVVHFKGLQPGPANLILQVRGGRHRSNEVARVSYVLKPGAQSTSIALPTLYTLRVHGGTGQVSLMTNSRDRSKGHVRMHANQAVDAEGVAVFDAIPAGDYRLQSRRKQTTVSLPGPSEVTLEERKR